MEVPNEDDKIILDIGKEQWKSTLKQIEREDLSFETHNNFIKQSLRIIKLNEAIQKKENPGVEFEKIEFGLFDGIQSNLVTLIQKNMRIVNIDNFIKQKVKILYNEAEDLRYYNYNWKDIFPKMRILKKLMCLLKLSNGDTYNFYAFQKYGSKLETYKWGFGDSIIDILELSAYTDKDINILLYGNTEGYLSEERFAKYDKGLWQKVKRKKEDKDTYSYTLTNMERDEKLKWIKNHQIHLVYLCQKIVYEPKNKAMIFLKNKRYYFNLYKESKLMAIENDKWENIPYRFTDVDFPILYPYLHHLVSADESCLNYLLAWLSQIIGDPGVRTKILLVLYGPNRTGKTSFYNYIIKPIFESNASSSYSLIGEMLRNNVDLMHSSFIFIEDVDIYGNKGEQVLKRVIDENEHSLRYLYNEVIEIPNFHNFLLTTNNLESIKVGKKGRIFPLEVTKDSDIKNLIDTQMNSAFSDTKLTPEYETELKLFVLFLKYHYGLLSEKYGNLVTWLNNKIPTTSIIEEIQSNQYDDIQRFMDDIGGRKLTIQELLVENTLIKEDSDENSGVVPSYNSNNNDNTDYKHNLKTLEKHALLHLRGDYVSDISEIKAEDEKRAILTTGVYILFTLWGCRLPKTQLTRKIKRIILETLPLKLKHHINAVISNYFRANKQGFHQDLFYRACIVLNGQKDIEENYFWKKPRTKDEIAKAKKNKDKNLKDNEDSAFELINFDDEVM